MDYIILSTEYSSLALAIKQKDDEYNLYFNTKDTQNVNQKFYIKWNEENASYLIISYSRTQSIGMKYERSDSWSFVIETDLSFKQIYF